LPAFRRGSRDDTREFAGLCEFQRRAELAGAVFSKADQCDAQLSPTFRIRKQGWRSHGNRTCRSEGLKKAAAAEVGWFHDIEGGGARIA
jgi:hypothetical protein